MSDQQSTAQGKKDKKISKIIAVVCVVVIVIVGAVLLLRGDSAAPGSSGDKQASSDSDAVSLFLAPASQTLSKGQAVSVGVWVNSDSQNINTVEADLNYPENYFDFVKVDGNASSFPFGVQGDAKDGVITIVRGGPNAVRGNVQVATVELKAKDKTGTAQISFTNKSKVFDAKTNKNILTETSSGKYTIKN